MVVVWHVPIVSVAKSYIARKKLFEFFSLNTGYHVGLAVGCLFLHSNRLNRNPTFQIPVYRLLPNNTVRGTIPTENSTVENYFSRKLFHYKLIGPTSLTIKMMIDPTKA